MYSKFNGKGVSTIKGPSVVGSSVPLTGPSARLTGDPFPLRASFNSLIVGRMSGAFDCQGSGLSLRI